VKSDLSLKISSLNAVAMGEKPADLILKNGVDAWRESIRNSKHFIEFMLLRILKDANSDSRKAGREIKEHLLPVVNAR